MLLYWLLYTCLLLTHLILVASEISVVYNLISVTLGQKVEEYVQHSTGRPISKRIAFVLPKVSSGGGVYVVLKHAELLLEAGYDAFVINFQSREACDAEDTSWSGITNVRIVCIADASSDDIGNLDAVVATFWATAEFVSKMKARNHLYFVQSDERRFSSRESWVRSSNASYSLDLFMITEALWIKKWLRDEFEKNATYVPNGLDPSLFYDDKLARQARRGGRLRVLLEGPLDLPWKGVADAYEAVKDLDVDIWLVSSSGTLPDAWRVSNNLGQVPLTVMGSIYRSVDIFLKMSRIEGFFGPPLEAMACGCAVVVGKVTGYEEYIVHNHNALVVEMGDIKGARIAVQSIIASSTLQARLIHAGALTARDWTWGQSHKLMKSALDSIIFSTGNKSEIIKNQNKVVAADDVNHQLVTTGSLVLYVHSPAVDAQYIIGDANQVVVDVPVEFQVIGDHSLSFVQNSSKVCIEMTERLSEEIILPTYCVDASSEKKWLYLNSVEKGQYQLLMYVLGQKMDTMVNRHFSIGSYEDTLPQISFGSGIGHCLITSGTAAMQRMDIVLSQHESIFAEVLIEFSLSASSLSLSEYAVCLHVVVASAPKNEEMDVEEGEEVMSLHCLADSSQRSLKLNSKVGEYLVIFFLKSTKTNALFASSKRRLLVNVNVQDVDEQPYVGGEIMEEKMSWINDHLENLFLQGYELLCYDDDAGKGLEMRSLIFQYKRQRLYYFAYAINDNDGGNEDPQEESGYFPKIDVPMIKMSTMDKRGSAEKPVAIFVSSTLPLNMKTVQRLYYSLLVSNNKEYLILFPHRLMILYRMESVPNLNIQY